MFASELLPQANRRTWIVLLLACSCLPFEIGHAQTPQPVNATETVLLTPLASHQREFAEGAEKRHVYYLPLAAQQCATVTVGQQSVDVLARLVAPDGQLLAEVDSEMTPHGVERIEVVAEVGGNYRIELEPSLTKAGVGTYTIQFPALRPATPDDKALDQARRSFYEALRLNLDGRFDEAVAAANRALEIRERILGPSGAEVAASLQALGTIYLSKIDLVQAERSLRRAAETIEKLKGSDNLDYAEALSGLANVRFRQGNLAEAEQWNERALAIRERVAGADSVASAKSLFNLASIYRGNNNLPKAEQTHLKVLSIRERLLGEDHFEIAQSLNNLGLLYYGAGDFPKAEKCLQRSVLIREKRFHPDHWQVGQALNNLGLVAWKKGELDEATEHYLRALRIFAATSGAESDGVASISHNLGIIYKESGDAAQAETYYKRALAIWEKIYGEDNVSTANALSSLAILYLIAGDYAQAEPLDLRALAIREKVAGEYNQYTILSLRHLVKLYAAKGDVDRALEYQKRLLAIEAKVIPLNLSTGSERQKIAYFEQLAPLDVVMTLHAQFAENSDAAAELAATSLLQRKGRILDALSDSVAALRRRLNPQDQSSLDKLSDIHTRLSRLLLSGRQKATAEDYQKQVRDLEAEREKLEEEVGRRSAGFYEGSNPVTLAAVRAAIPPDAALVEFAVYRPVDWRGSKEETSYGAARYVAYVLRREGAIQSKDLGPAAPIEAAISDWRKALSDPKRKDAQQLARNVEEKIMQPIRSMAGEAARWLISPDGELNLIPFEALVDEKGKYLVQNHSFVYVTSGRDLLRMKVARASQSKDVVMANPRFGEPTPEQLVAKNKPDTAPENRLRSVTAAASLADTYFAPLAGTLQEARSIEALFPEALFLTGAAASEAALKQVNAPRVLHIATHGFFLSGPAAPAGGATQNPLLRSGLALADANLRKNANGTGDDGIVTALEASGLNLWGTKLVVLSACDTGLGEVKNGEGVYGLRRAFLLAGSESLVMSLWAVSDYSTRRLMEEYYKHLKQGDGRGAALREVQLKLLQKDPQLHPFYWANFINIGEWANLAGER